MSPRKIFNQPIRNGANGANATWLRAINDWEHDSDPIPELAAAPVSARTADSHPTPAAERLYRPEAAQVDEGCAVTA